MALPTLHVHFPNGTVRQVLFSEDQPRDPNGRWAGGSAEGQNAEHAKTPAEHSAAAEYHTQAVNDLKTGAAAKAHADAAVAHKNAANINDAKWSRAAHGWSKAAHSATVAAQTSSTGPLSRDQWNQNVLDRLRQKRTGGSK